MAQFGRSNAPFFTTYFGLRHGLPSYEVFRNLLQGLDKNALAQAFGRWFTLQAQAGDWVAGDGQSLRSIMQGAQQADQSFVSVVSLHFQRMVLTLVLRDYMDKKRGDERAARLARWLAGLGRGFHARRAACPKKRPPPS